MTGFEYAPIVAAYTAPTWLSSLDLSDLSAMAADVAGVVAPVMIAVLVTTLGIGLVKKLVRKAV